MLKEYPKFERGEIEEFYKKISKAEQKTIQEYLTYRKARGVGTEDKLKDIRRYILHLRFILDKEFKNMNLNDLRGLLAVINGSRLTNLVQNSVKTDLKNFLKYYFRDWSDRFSNLEDIKLGSNSKNEEKINSKNLFSKEDIEKIVKAEPKIYWKAFFLVQYEAGLRTKETRMLKWEDIKLNEEGDISEVQIYSTKTQKARTIFVKEATFYLKQLKQEQENTKTKGVYVFHSPSNIDKSNINKPIAKSSVNKWFRERIQKTLGRKGWNYLLRHSRATELYRLAKQGKIAKDIAIDFMGHSEDMSGVYSHFDSKEIKEMLKNQVYKLEELPEKEKNELIKRMDRIEKKFEEYDKIIAGLKRASKK